MGPIYIPKKGDSFKIDKDTNWKYLLPIMIMEGHKATLQDKDVTLTFTLQDQFEIGRSKKCDCIIELIVLSTTGVSQEFSLA